MGWPPAIVTIVVILASVGGTVYSARLYISAESNRQRREHEIERIRRWSERAAETAARAEIALTALTSLRELDVDLPDLLANFDLGDMETRLWHAAGARVELRTVLALSTDAPASEILIELERRLRDSSEVVGALINERKLYGSNVERISNSAETAWVSFVSNREESDDATLSSLSTTELFANLRHRIATIIAATP